MKFKFRHEGKNCVGVVKRSHWKVVDHPRRKSRRLFVIDAAAAVADQDKDLKKMALGDHAIADNAMTKTLVNAAVARAAYERFWVRYLRAMETLCDVLIGDDVKDAEPYSGYVHKALNGTPKAWWRKLPATTVQPVTVKT